MANASPQCRLLGNRDNLIIGNRNAITRDPWPFFDVTGSKIIIEDDVVISSGVYILTHDHEFSKSNWRQLSHVNSDSPTVIRKKVFLGINALIMPTCKIIGKCSVIAAGSVVTKNVPDYEIWAGIPAKKISDVENCG